MEVGIIIIIVIYFSSYLWLFIIIIVIYLISGRKVALANEAKAALQVKEDFSLVKLKKVKEPGKLHSEGEENGGVKQSSVTNVLLKIKGIWFIKGLLLHYFILSNYYFKHTYTFCALSQNFHRPSRETFII